MLGVETSCDDTAAAVVHSDGRILGESKRSQNDLNQKWGGVVPGLARDAHQEAISQVLILILFLLSLQKRVANTANTLEKSFLFHEALESILSLREVA